MEQQRIEVATPEGSMTTFVHRPTHGGPHPVVLYLMDAPSIRPELHDMASRLASASDTMFVGVTVPISSKRWCMSASSAPNSLNSLPR